MRIQAENGRYIVCGHIFKKAELEVGQQWAQADGANRVVSIRKIETLKDGDVLVHYGEYGNDRTFEKDWFSFQCRYCLVVG